MSQLLTQLAAREALVDQSYVLFEFFFVARETRLLVQVPIFVMKGVHIFKVQRIV